MFCIIVRAKQKVCRTESGEKRRLGIKVFADGERQVFFVQKKTVKSFDRRS